MALPTFVANGTPSGGTGNVTPGIPAGVAVNDKLLLFIQNKRLEATPTHADYTFFAQSTPTSGNKLTILERDVQGGETAPTIIDTGDHLYAVILAWRDPGGGLLELKNLLTEQINTATTAAVWSAITTTDADRVIINALAHGIDASGQQVSGVANASLASCVERFDNSITSNDGGGLFVATGGKAVAGSTGSTTATLAVASVMSLATFSIGPVAAGSNTAQTITVSATATVSMSRSAGKVIAATCSSAVTLARAVAKRISATATAAVSVGKAATRTLAVAASAAVTVRKAAGKVIDATSSAAVTLATSLQFARTITVAATASVSMARGIGKTIAATGTASVSVAKGVAHSIAVAATATTSMGKAVGKTIAASAVATALVSAIISSGPQVFYQTISVSVGAAVTVQKGIAKRISVTVASLVAMFANSSVFVFGMNIVRAIFQSRNAVVPPVAARVVAVPHQQRIVVVPAEGRVVNVGAADRDAETLEQSRTIRVEDD